jgi:hypothetical protein
MTPRRIRWFLSLQDVLLTTTAHIARHSYIGFILPFTSSIHNKHHSMVTTYPRGWWFPLYRFIINNDVPVSLALAWHVIINTFQFPEETSVCEVCRFLSYSF